ncbi:MAG: GntR family transcriptional regulator [Planctomycetota bacterium]
MLFSIDVDSDVAIYEQIVHQVQFAVAGGVLVGGQMVPSVRQLANQLAINPNTIARAYQELQAQQVLQPLRGRGLVVRNDAVTRCTQTRNRILQQGIDAAIATAVHSGLAHEDIRQMVTDSMQQQFQTATSVADNMNDKATGNGAASES